MHSKKKTNYLGKLADGMYVMHFELGTKTRYVTRKLSKRERFLVVVGKQTIEIQESVDGITIRSFPGGLAVIPASSNLVTITPKNYIGSGNEVKKGKGKKVRE
jgi:hypothetical protein